VEIDGRPVETIDDLQRMMGADAIGAHLPLRVLRDGTLHTLAIVPEELPEDR
jgi:S1-C subfamily serine protease